MDQNLSKIVQLRIERTVQALQKNGYDAHFVKSRGELHTRLDEYLPKGASCTVGGSMTLFETGVIEKLETGDYQYYNRYAPGADLPEVYRKAFSCDVYLSSVNAITEDGLLYNMDGRGNRVSAITFGPKKVVLVAGFNKIVHDLEQARLRNRAVSAPANNVRLATGNPCAKLGYCTDCKNEKTICVTEVVHRYQPEKGRIAVLIMGEAYGY